MSSPAQSGARSAQSKSRVERGLGSYSIIIVGDGASVAGAIGARVGVIDGIGGLYTNKR